MNWLAGFHMIRFISSANKVVIRIQSRIPRIGTKLIHLSLIVSLIFSLLGMPRITKASQPDSFT
jgi:hypothetical protein